MERREAVGGARGPTSVERLVDAIMSVWICDRSGRDALPTQLV